MTDQHDAAHETANALLAKPRLWLAIIGLAIMLAGGLLAQQVRTAGGVKVSDIRFTGTDGVEMSALLYVPENATADTPAPGILAVHGYINSRETQDGFAIEFAQRGYVVLSLDQTGHGYSGGAAFSNGFGGPDALKYLRALPMVDTANIGLEGHSMGGWTVLAAAAEMPKAYQSMVLQGSSTGAPFALDGTAEWPRNLALVFAEYDEFSDVMWGVDRASKIGEAGKLQTLFGADSSIEEGKLYGSLSAGTARVLHQPAVTHPGNHLSTESIGHAVDWFALTLKGGSPKPANDQTWYWKEFGTGIGLVGFVMLLLGAFDTLLRLPIFAPLCGPAVPPVDSRDRGWWRSFAFNTLMPALLFFPAFIAVYLLLPASVIQPQTVTSQVMMWALLGSGIGLLIGRIRKNPASGPQSPWLPTIALAVGTAAIGYLALLMLDMMFLTDIRFWVLAVKLPSVSQWGIAGIYVLPLTLAFVGTAKSLADTAVRSDGPVKLYLAAIATLTAGMAAMLVIIYGLFFVTGYLATAFDPLSTVIALQFVPILAAIAIIGIFTWKRTGSHRPGGVLVGILVTLYVVAGTATQAA